MFKSCIINEIKNKATNALYEKSHLIIQDYFNEGKVMVLTQNPIIQRFSQRVILAVATVLQKVDYAALVEEYHASLHLVRKTFTAYNSDRIAKTAALTIFKKHYYNY
jgi:hypothetical protein